MSGLSRPTAPWLSKEPRPSGWGTEDKKPLVAYGVWMPRTTVDPSRAPQRSSMANEKQVASNDSQSFIYMDVGCWCDNALGGGERRRDFGLVCGPHIFICEFDSSGIVPKNQITRGQSFFDEMAIQGCGIKINQYRYADTTRRMTDTSQLYLFLGDLHLPPVSLYHDRAEISAIGMRYDPPDWLDLLIRARPETEGLMRNYYSAAEAVRQSGHYYPAHGPMFGGNPDIFGQAEDDLVYFLTALCNIDVSIKQSLNFIQVGDMFELMLSEDYQFQPGPDGPTWKNQKSPIWVYDWALEVIIQNAPIIAAFSRLGRTGLAQCRFVWGNHDCYLSDGNIARELGLPNRLSYFTDLDGKLFCEHGHRLDEFCADDRSSLIGNKLLNVSYFIPSIRQWENTLRKSAGQKERQAYLDGATAAYQQKKIALYVMAHTHTHDLQRIVVPVEDQS